MQALGCRFATGVDALEDPNRESRIDDRFDYGEERIVTLGLGKNGLLYVVSTELSENWTRTYFGEKAEDD